jgi:hypothetical protein
MGPQRRRRRGEQLAAPPNPEEEVHAVFTALKACDKTPYQQVVEELIASCRSKLPDATTEEIVWAIGERVMGATRKDSPLGYLLTVVPKLFPLAVVSRRKGRQATGPRRNTAHNRITSNACFGRNIKTSGWPVRKSYTPTCSRCWRSSENVVF